VRVRDEVGRLTIRGNPLNRAGGTLSLHPIKGEQVV
jgi:hypothetical protein